MLRSLPELGNTLVFMLFFFIVFGIIGIQTFHGAIYQRCRLTPEPVDGQWEIDPDQEHFICSKGATEGPNACQKGSYCYSPIDRGLNPEIDKPWENELILYNTVNFNNLPCAVISVFEALTLEGWSIQMENIINTGNVELAVIFYLLLIAFGSYFILNLILAVIMGSFTKFENKEIEEKIHSAEQAELQNVSK